MLRRAMSVVGRSGRRQRCGCGGCVRAVGSVDHVHPEDAGDDRGHQQQERGPPSKSRKSPVGQAIGHVYLCSFPFAPDTASIPLEGICVESFKVCSASTGTLPDPANQAIPKRNTSTLLRRSAGSPRIGEWAF